MIFHIFFYSAINVKSVRILPAQYIACFDEEVSIRIPPRNKAHPEFNETPVQYVIPFLGISGKASSVL